MVYQVGVISIHSCIGAYNKTYVDARSGGIDQLSPDPANINRIIRNGWAFIDDQELEPLKLVRAVVYQYFEDSGRMGYDQYTHPLLFP